MIINNDSICNNCGAKRGFHSHKALRCPMNPNCDINNTEYRNTVFGIAERPESTSPTPLIKALKEIRDNIMIGGYDNSYHKLKNIAREALSSFESIHQGEGGKEQEEKQADKIREDIVDMAMENKPFDEKTDYLKEKYHITLK